MDRSGEGSIVVKHAVKNGKHEIKTVSNRIRLMKDDVCIVEKSSMLENPQVFARMNATGRRDTNISSTGRRRNNENKKV